VPGKRLSIRWPGLLVAGTAVLALACQPSGSGAPSATPNDLPSSSPAASTSASAEPTEAPASLLVRLTSEIHNPPALSLRVEILSDGRVVEGGQPWSTRTLTAAGLEQVEATILSSPLLQDSADYPWVLAVPPEQAPIGISGTWTFVIGEQPEPIVVRSGVWLDEAEPLYFVPSPEREELDRLAHLLADPASWVTADGWVETESAPFQAEGYLLWVTVWSETAPEGLPSAAGVTWPFDGPIESFGEVVATDLSLGRCGYLEPPQAADLEASLTEVGAPTDVSRRVDLATDGGWVGLYLSPRTVDGFPTCADEAPFQPPYVSVP
jgi:hypothetical protein